MSTARFNTLKDLEGEVEIDVKDLQVTYDALVQKGQYREGIVLRKYQDAFIKEGEIYIGDRRKLPYATTGNWEVDKEHVRLYTTIDNSASVAIVYANLAQEYKELSEQYKEKADKWANAAHGEEVEEGKYSARHYAEEAELITGTKDFLRKSRNLSDVNVPMARHNLGIGTAGSAALVQEEGDSEEDVMSQLAVSSSLEGIRTNTQESISTLSTYVTEGLSQLREDTQEGLDTKLSKTSNLGDVSDVSLARDNLELGTAATKDIVGSLGDDSELIPSQKIVTDSLNTKLTKSENLGDLPSQEDARDNLGLKSAAIKDTTAELGDSTDLVPTQKLLTDSLATKLEDVVITGTSEQIEVTGSASEGYTLSLAEEVLTDLVTQFNNLTPEQLDIIKDVLGITGE